MIDAKIDVPLLRKQRNFLLEAWRGEELPEEIEGLVNLLDHILDVEEGYIQEGKALREMQIEFEVDER